MNRNQAMNAALIDSEIEIGNMGREAAFMRVAQIAQDFAAFATSMGREGVLRYAG